MMEVSSDRLRFYVYVESQNGCAPQEILRKIAAVFPEDAPSLRTIQRWIADFNSGERSSFSDETRSGRPCTARSDENVLRIQNLITDDPKLSIRDLEELTGINRDAIHKILRTVLKLRHVFSVWVPHDLTPQNKENRVIAAQELLHFLQSNPADVEHNYCSVDESWIFHRNVGTKAGNKVWLSKDERRPQVPKGGLTPHKSLLILAVTFDGKFYCQVLPKNMTLNSDGYISFLKDLGNAWRRLSHNPLSLREMYLQHDNARPHRASAVEEFCRNRGIHLLRQSPYSPDLTFWTVGSFVTSNRRFLTLVLKHQKRFLRL